MKPPPQGPHNFLPGPTGPAPLQQRARIVEVPVVATPPPARSAAILSVRLPNRITLRRALVELVNDIKRRPGETRSKQAIKFEKGSPVELVPPARRGGVWHLDTRPTAGRRLSWTADQSAQFATSHQLKAEHFLRVQTVGQIGLEVKGGKHNRTSIAGDKMAVRSRLHFQLGEEVVPGYFALLPV